MKAAARWKRASWFPAIHHPNPARKGPKGMQQSLICAVVDTFGHPAADQKGPNPTEPTQQQPPENNQDLEEVNYLRREPAILPL